MTSLDYRNNDRFIICKIDGKNIQASVGESLLQVCFKAYIDIPRFCYHEGLQIAGNCRMCLVEVENNRKLVASCATPVVNGLSVFTKTFRIKKARQAVLEFLLINHPLDCPICDQGGECDLQDITLVFGSDRGRFYEMSKRAVMDKNLGPLIKTIMNRCIHCTRCVRFFKEVAVGFDKSISTLGVLGRGSRMEIGTYISTNLLHELSGNIIDLCPVGALTSKPFAFKARSWELTSQYNFDVVDVFMPRIKMDLSGLDVLRILPYMDEYGHGWISNKTRFYFDSLNQARTSSCLWHYDSMLQSFCELLKGNFINGKKVNFFIKVSWKDAFRLFFSYMKNNINYPINKNISSSLSLEQTWSFKSFLLSTGMDFLNESFSLNTLIDFRSFFTIDISLDSLDHSLWVLVLLGINLRMESPLLFLHIKRLVAKDRVYLISTLNTNILQKNINNLSLTLNGLVAFLEGRSAYNRILLKKMLFHKFLFLVNMEFSTTKAFKDLSLVFVKIFSKYCIISMKSNNLFKLNSVKDMTIYPTFSTSVLQRYVGNISLSEMGLYNIKQNAFNKGNCFKGLNVYIDTINTEFYKGKLANNNSNILLTQSRFVTKLLNEPELFSKFSLILPFKSLYTEEGQQFFDLFMNQKAIVNVKPSVLNEKSFSDILTTLSTFMMRDSMMFVSSPLSMNVESWIQALGLQSLECEQNFNTTYKGINMIDSNLFWNLQQPYITLTFHHIFRSFSLKQLGIRPLLNFYNDSKLNLVSYSNTLKRSSLVFQKNNQFTSFGLFKF